VIDSSRFCHTAVDRFIAMMCLACLGGIYSEQERLAELEPLLRQATDIMQGVTDVEPPYYFTLLFLMAGLYLAQGVNEKAEAAFKELITVGQGWLKSELVLMSLNLGLAASYVAQEKNYVDVEMHLQHARSVLLQTMPEHPFLEYIYEGLIDVYLEQGEVADLAVTLQDLANLYYSQGRYIERIHQYAEIVKNEQLKKEQPWIVADGYLALGINNLRFISHWLPDLEPAEALEYFKGTEKILILARNEYEDLEEQENVEYVQTVLEALYQERSSYSEMQQGLIDQTAENPDTSDEAK
jgi:tetratricopeptide (TPR) repeat protein